MINSMEKYIVAAGTVSDWSTIFPIKRKYSTALNNIFSGFTYQGSSGTFIRRDHNLIYDHQKSDRMMKSASISKGCRQDITDLMKSKNMKFTGNIPHRDFAVVMDGDFCLVYDENKLPMQPYILNLKQWKTVTKTIYGAVWDRANWPKRRRLILNTIRHGMDYYDLYIKTHGVGQASRLFIQYITNNYPELKSGLSDFILKKENSGTLIAENLKTTTIDEEARNKIVTRLDQLISEE